MIKAIHLNSCVPYQQADISECKKINFIFGSNGCGKSTVSSFLAGSSDPRFASCTIDWENDIHETVCVYNRDFRRDNFRQTIPGIFTMGSDTIKEREEIEELKSQLQKKREEYETQKDTLQKKKDEKSAREARFRDDAWIQILKKNEGDFQKAFEGFRSNKEKFKQELKERIITSKGKVCDRQSLSDRATTLYASKPERCSRFFIDIQPWLDKLEEIRTDAIWDTVIAGNKDIDISALIAELHNSPWVDQGRLYIRDGSRKCPFCQQETITEEFRAKLEAFFDTEYTKKVASMELLLREYQEATDHIVAALEGELSNQEAVKVGKLDTELFQTKEVILSQLYADHEAKIKEKIQTPGIKIAIPDVTDAVKELLGFINKANKNIDAHNKLVSERDTAIAELTDDVWATCIDVSSSLITTYNTDIVNLDKAITGITNALNSKDKAVKELDELIVQKSKNLTSVQPTIDEINRSLKAYGFNNFFIQPADGQEDYYCIKRPDGTSATNTLSEGEETFLTFLYFIQQTKGSTDQAHVNDKKIIVLDDPISSLDSTILYIVGAIVKDLSRKIRDGVGDVNQLFVLTHNVFFHKEASFDPRQNLRNNINFWMIRKDNDVSIIQNYEQDNPISTSYELLWRDLRENKNISRISIQNTMRRIIENYFRMLGKGKDETLIENFDTAEEQMIARSLLFWINDGSHSIPDDLHIDSYTDAVPKYHAVFRKIFEKSGHLSHYNMLMKIEDSEEANPSEPTSTA